MFLRGPSMYLPKYFTGQFMERYFSWLNKCYRSNLPVVFMVKYLKYQFLYENY